MEKTDDKKEYRILVIVPEEYLTKIAVFANETNERQFRVYHEPERISAFSSVVYDQFEFRLREIREALRREDINVTEFDAIAGTGGWIAEDIKGGVYEVNAAMVEQLKRPVREDVVNLGGLIAKELADEIGAKAYVVDPPCVDETSDLSRAVVFVNEEHVTKGQALVQRYLGRKAAEELGKPYEACRLITGEIGNYVAVGAQADGHLIDVNSRRLINDNVREVERMASEGNKRSAAILEAIAYDISKEIGAKAPVLKGDVDAIVLTGGLVLSKTIRPLIEDRVRRIAPVMCFPVDAVAEGLALGTLRCLRGEEAAEVFKGRAMTFKTFDEIEDYIRKSRRVKRIALCGSHDEPALKSVIKARRRGFATAILIGKADETKDILFDLGEDPMSYEIIDEPDEAKAAAKAVALVREGRADIPMKGLLQTAAYMRAILNKETGIMKPGALLSETTITEYTSKGRFLFVTDCAINIEPDIKAKVGIIKNAVNLARSLGVEMPKVACLSALENVNPKIRSTEDAAELAQMEWEGCYVEGPFALDNAIDIDAAEHKGVVGNVAGQADILLVPDLISGNILHKSLHFFAGGMIAGVVCGTDYPVILTSRTDEPDTKYRSILLAILLSLKRTENSTT